MNVQVNRRSKTHSNDRLSHEMQLHNSSSMFSNNPQIEILAYEDSRALPLAHVMKTNTSSIRYDDRAAIMRMWEYVLNALLGSLGLDVTCAGCD